MLPRFPDQWEVLCELFKFSFVVPALLYFCICSLSTNKGLSVAQDEVTCSLSMWANTEASVFVAQAILITFVYPFLIGDALAVVALLASMSHLPIRVRVRVMAKVRVRVWVRFGLVTPFIHLFVCDAGVAWASTYCLSAVRKPSHVLMLTVIAAAGAAVISATTARGLPPAVLLTVWLHLLRQLLKVFGSSSIQLALGRRRHGQVPTVCMYNTAYKSTVH